jgi:hypothetical protein
MHRVRRLVLVALVGLLPASACAQDVRLSDTVTTYAYHRDDGGDWFLNPSTTEVGGYEGDEEKLGIAVEWLLTDNPSPERGRSFWSGGCAPGERVTSVDVRDDLVTLRLEGGAASSTCELSDHEAEMQRQQVAWTVRKALDPLGSEGASTPVRVIDAGGRSWPVVTADEAYLAPSWRPTPRT